MPNYSYSCDKCHKDFEIFSYIKDYNPQPKCILCNSKQTHRNYIADSLTQSCSIKKSDSELKTLGDLAMRNTERMSEDEKTSLYMKHNAYKYDKEETQPLPSGMSRMKKPPKTKWPGSTNKRKRRDLKQ